MESGYQMNDMIMTEKEISELKLGDFRELTSDEETRDNCRRMFQIMGLIYKFPFCQYL
jgi:hypothetical protein